MSCLADRDQPLRVRLSKDGVVHAAAYRNFGGFTRYSYSSYNHNSDTAESREEYVPKQKRIEIACRWRFPKKDMSKLLISNAENITCKSCMKRMGMVEGPISPKRYVVLNKDTGEYMKNTSSRCSGWSESLSDAFFFRTEHTAKDKCRVSRYRVGDELMTYAELKKAGNPKYKRERIDDPCLEVRSVKIVLD